MGVNKVVKGNAVMLDLTEDTVTENNLLAGATAHNAAGEAITGAVAVAPIDSELSETSENAVQNKAVTAALNNKADKSEIPKSLPANGGNADTVGGLSASSFVQNFSDWNSGSVKDLALASKSGYVFINNGVTDMPFNNGYWFGNIHASSNHRHIVVSDISENKTYVRSYNAATKSWTEWKNISEIQNTCVTGSTTKIEVVLGFQPSAVIIVNSSGVVYLPSEITATGFKCKYIAEGTSRVYWAFR